MTDAGQRLKDIPVRPGTLLIMWLGQSGFYIKASDETAIMIDPYLTNTIHSGYRPYIHARMIPPVIGCSDASGLKALLYTHDHMDHMDPNTVVQLLWNTDAQIIASAYICKNTLTNTMHVPEERMKQVSEYMPIMIGSIKVTPVPANHSAGALGYMLEAEGQCLYFCGDTQLFYDMKELGERFNVDTAFLCFNGQGGNMDVCSAVAAAEAIKTKRVVPVHYGMYADNNADPDNLELALKKKLPDVKFIKLFPGKITVFPE